MDPQLCFRDDAKGCPICGVPVRTYRIATLKDQRRKPQGAVTEPTGPEHYVAHGCAADYKPVGR